MNRSEMEKSWRRQFDMSVYMVDRYHVNIHITIYEEFDEKLNSLLTLAKMVGWKLDYDVQMNYPYVIFERGNERRELWFKRDNKLDLTCLSFNSGYRYGFSLTNEISIAENQRKKFISVLERAMRYL